jgi:para-nitrobenzyl esterase
VIGSRSLGFYSFLLLTLTALGCGGETPTADSATTRTIAQGELVGASIEEGRVHVWRGIPFATPPVDVHRWRAPAPPHPWQGKREALVSGSECPQLGGDPVMGDEDCLYLDIFTPAILDQAEEIAGLPVMFWIHGGGNTIGAGNQLPPEALARDNGVVVVTINYRLGLFGWLAHPALRATAEGPEDASGNFGTLDMIRALEWVRTNIWAFGGDPGRVTIFGESAGGMNIFSLLVSPRAKGLFHAAIAESGSPTAFTRGEAENYTDDPQVEGMPGSSAEIVIALLRQAGLAEDRESAKLVAANMSLAEIEAFLRSQSSESLLAPFAALMEGGMPIYMVPNIFQDGHVVSLGEPLELLGTAGAYNSVPFIAGTNREEHKLFFAMNSPHLETTFGMPSGFKSERLYDVEGEYGGLMWRAMGADEPISAMRRVQGPTVWSYRFDWDEEPKVLGMDLSKLIGAGHAVEMLFVFGLTDLGFANRFVFEDQDSADRLSQQMRSYWANFAYTYRPGRGQLDDLPEWKPWGEGRSDPKYLIFDSDRDGGIEVGYDQVDQAFVLGRAGKDPRLFDDEERCRVYRNFVQWSESMTVAEYAALDGGACSEWPLKSRLSFPGLSHYGRN